MKHLTRFGVAMATGAAAFALGATAPAYAAPGGANQDCGAYCPNLGAPSMNGKGHGHAKGRPDAGTVGKADSKNPPGQAPDASDGNNGYECDGNEGIAKGNPAHTGCDTVPPPTS